MLLRCLVSMCASALLAGCAIPDPRVIQTAEGECRAVARADGYRRLRAGGLPRWDAAQVRLPMNARRNQTRLDLDCVYDRTTGQAVVRVANR
jgi:hypothetical protein